MERLTVAHSFSWLLGLKKLMEKDGRKVFTNDRNGEGGDKSAM